jgi:pimeloyl-ACP methyl ester carboxylesterase
LHKTFLPVKKYSLLIALQFVISAGLTQPYLVGNRSITFSDPSRNNRSIATNIYYPANTSGSNVPVAGNPGDKFPVLVFGHGFVMTTSAYANIWNAVVPQGYIIMLPTTESGFSPSHTEFAKDIAFLVTAMQNEGQNNSSPFYNKVDSTSCVMGHSMGGGSSFLSVQYNSSITAIANLAAAETNPSAIAACANITLPALVIAGGNDCITPPANHQLPMYNALASACKTYVSITGGSHCQMAESNFNCNLGELTCSPPPAITRAQQHAIINSLLIPWLNYHLKGDCNAWSDFQNLLSAGSGITSQQSCTACVTGITPPESSGKLKIFPVPARNHFFVQTDDDIASVNISIYNLQGVKISEQFISRKDYNGFKAESPANTGIYLIELMTGKGERRYSRLIVQ